MHLSQRFANFMAEILVIIGWISGNATHLNVQGSKVTELQGDLADYKADYDIYVSPSGHTPGSVTNINDSYHHVHPKISAIQQQIKKDTSVVLDGNDYANLHIHQDKAHRAHIPARDFAPNNQVLKQTHLVTHVFTNNPAPALAKVTAMPADVKQIGRKIAIVKAGDPAPAENQYVALEAIGATQYDLFFMPSQVQIVSTAYLITWYISPTGEAGPESLPLSFTII